MPRNAEATQREVTSRRYRGCTWDFVDTSIMPHAARILAWGVGAACAFASPQAARAQSDLDDRIPQAVTSQLHVTSYAVVPLTLPTSPDPAVSILVNLDGVPYALELARTSLRSPAFQVVTQDQSGALVGVEPPAPRTYRGTAIAFGQTDGDGTSVVASLLEHGLVARITIPGVDYAIQPLSDVLADAPADLHVVYRVDAVEPLEFECGTHDEHVVSHTNGSTTNAFGGGSAFGAQAATTTKVAELAFDCDYEFFVANGSSVPATVADVETVMNAVDATYRGEVDISYELTTIVIRTSSADPYTSSDSSTLLQQFRNYWNAQFAAIPRDTAHLMTGRAVDGNVIGLAYVGVVCNGSYGYGLSESRFTSNAVYRASLTAHELGHNWNANHCNGQSDCAIMCSSIGGCNGLTTFAVQDETSINGWKNAIGCLDTQPSAIVGALADDFPGATLDAMKWSWIHGALANSGGVNPPSGATALNLDAAGAGIADDDEIRSAPIDLSGASNVLLQLESQHRGVESGETLIAEGLTSTGHWTTLLTVTSDGSDQTTFAAQSAALPSSMLHSAFRLRLRVECNETNDEWYVDDVLVSADQAPPAITSIALTPGNARSGADVQVVVGASDDVGIVTATLDLKLGGATLSTTSLTVANTSTLTGTLSIPGGLAETVYDLAVSAADSSGNLATYAATVDVYDTPVLSSPQFTPASPQDIDAVGVSVVATDSLAVASVSASGVIDGADEQTIALSFDANTGRYVGAFAAFDMPGTLDVRFDAIDSTNHDATPLDTSVTLSGSGQLPPRITIDPGVASTVEIGTPFDVTANVVDHDSAITSVVARIVQGATVLATTPLSATQSTWTGSIDTTGIDEQLAALELVAQDAQGHLKSATQPLTLFDVPQWSNLTVTPTPADAGDFIHVEVAITDASPVATATAAWTYGGAAIDAGPLTFDALSNTYVADFDPLGHAGAFTLTLSATDTFGIAATPLTDGLDVEVEPLDLTTVTPAKGSAQGGSAVALTGSGFVSDVAAGSLKLYANGVLCTHVVATSNTALTAKTPKLAAGPVTFEVRAKKLGSPYAATLAGAYAVFDPPSIAAVSPGSGSAHGGAVVVISGTRFQDDVVADSTTVRIGSHVADDVEVVDDATLLARFTSAGASEANVDVVVTNSRGKAAKSKAFTWTAVGLRTRAIVPVSAAVTALAAAADSGPHATSIVLGMPSAGARGALATIDLADGALTALPAPPAPFEAFGAALLELGATTDASGLAVRVGAPATDASTTGGSIAAVATTVDAAVGVEAAPAPHSELGAALAPLLDADDDGTIDVFAAGCPGNATVLLYANATAGAESSWSPADPGSRFGAALAARAIGPNSALLLSTAPDAAPLAQAGAGSAYLARIDVSGATVVVTPIAQFDGDAAGDATSDEFAMACALPGDLDGDGTVDAIVGFPGAAGCGRVVAYSGATGAVLWARSGEFAGDAFGTALTALPDLDGDGIVDVGVGAPGVDEPGADDVGAVTVIAGKSGQPLARLAFTVADARGGATLAAFADRDGDLLVDLVATTRATAGADAVLLLSIDPRSCARRAFAGDRLSGSLRDADERDGLWFGALGGEEFEWTLSGSTADAPLRVVLVDVDGTLLASSDPSSSAYDADVFTQEAKRLVVRFGSDATRSFAVLIGDPHATTKRSYQLRSRRTSSATVPWTESIALDGSGGSVEIAFDGTALATLSGTVTAADGATALGVGELATPSGGDLAALNPKAFVLGKPAHAVKVKPKKLTLPETGTYALRIDPATGVATSLNATLTLKLRRGKAKLKD